MINLDTKQITVSQNGSQLLVNCILTASSIETVQVKDKNQEYSGHQDRPHKISTVLILSGQLATLGLVQRFVLAPRKTWGVNALGYRKIMNINKLLYCNRANFFWARF
jgi:hypothetical protein